MIIIKCRTSYITVYDSRRIIFRKLSPAYGGVLTQQLLEGLGIPIHQTGDYYLNTTNYAEALEELQTISQLDLRRLGDGAVLTSAIERLRNQQVEVERL